METTLRKINKKFNYYKAYLNEKRFLLFKKLIYSLKTLKFD